MRGSIRKSDHRSNSQFSDYSQFASRFLLDCSLGCEIDESLVVTFLSGENPMENQAKKITKQAVQSLEPTKPSIMHFASRTLSDQELDAIVGGGDDICPEVRRL